jgi:hypothetical protein
MTNLAAVCRYPPSSLNSRVSLNFARVPATKPQHSPSTKPAAGGDGEKSRHKATTGLSVSSQQHTRRRNPRAPPATQTLNTQQTTMFVMRETYTLASQALDVGGDAEPASRLHLQSRFTPAVLRSFHLSGVRKLCPQGVGADPTGALSNLLLVGRRRQQQPPWHWPPLYKT